MPPLVVKKTTSTPDPIEPASNEVLPTRTSLDEELSDKGLKHKNKTTHKFFKLASSVFLVLLGSLAIFLVITLPTVLSVKKSGEELGKNLSELRSSVSTKDLALVLGNITKSHQSIEKFNNDLSRLSWLKPVPFLGPYVSDGQAAGIAGRAGLEAAEIVVKTVEPYADLLGLKGSNTAPDGAKTAQDRINFVVETLDKITPQLDKISEKLSLVSEKLNSIDPNRYPAEIKGIKIKETLTEAQQLGKEGVTLTRDAKPLLEAAPYILGIKDKRTYLAIFQNDAELRPTGGFMTAYAILEVQKGKVKPVFSGDIYDLDAKYNPSLKAPDALIKYVSFPYQKDPRWRLRDMNMNPDFKKTMEVFLPEYNKTGSTKVDGVISVDTQVLLELLKIIGRIGVPGQGNFSADEDPRCNCPVVIYELESVISVETPYLRTYRKAILGPLMNSIMSNAVGQPKEKIRELVGVFLRSIQGKHLMMYFLDNKVQDAVESFNMAGRVRQYEGDYLYIVGSNLAGAKSNLYLKTDVEDQIKVNSDGSAEHKLTVNYSNPQKNDRWLNGENRNWFRVYVPKGSVLTDSSGSEVKVDTTEESEKTVFSGFITVRPNGGVARFVLSYKVPALVKNHKYNLLIQKQPGIKDDPYIVNINSHEQDFELKEDKEISQTVK